MGKAMHTAGPWKAYEASERNPVPAGVFAEVGTAAGGGGKAGTVCEMVAQGSGGKYDPNETRANALLIAAAPDLYAACKLFLAKCRCVDIHHHGFGPAFDAAQAAVRKAEGE